MKIRLTISKLLLTIGLTVSIFSVNAQQKQLPDDENFVSELNSFMGVKTSLNKDLKTEVKAFTDKIETNAVSGEMRSQMIEIMNNYLAKRCAPSPHMLNLIKTFNAFCDKNKTQQFAVWYNYMKEYMAEKVSLTKINDNTMFIYHLIKDNSIETLGSKSWILSTDNFTLNIRDNGNGKKELWVDCQNVDLRCKMRNDSSLVIYSTNG